MKKVKRKYVRRAPTHKEQVAIARKQYESDIASLSSFVSLGSDPNVPERLILSGSYLTVMGAVNVVVSIADIRRAASIIKTRCVVP